MRLQLLPIISIILLLRILSVKTQQNCPNGQYLVTTSNTCVRSCPSSTFIGLSGTQNACLPQTQITSTAHPTSQDRTFTIIFSGEPFIGVSPQISVLLENTNMLQETLSLSAIFLTQDRTIIEVFVDAQEITSETLITFQFPDLLNNNASETHIINPAPITTLPSGFLSQGDLDSIQTLSKLDRGLEYAWIALTSFTPYAHLYMNVKLYRETIEMFKRVNVSSSKETTRFFRENNNKVSGFKLPNMFSILLLDSPASSGWSRTEENQLPSPGSDRAEDLKLSIIDTIRNYDTFPLFLDNYGIQITVFLGVLALIIGFEIFNFLFFRQSKGQSRLWNLFQGIRRYLRWNLLFGSFIGSYQSLMFYFMVQMQVYSKEGSPHSQNNKLNFWFAMGSFIIIGLFIPFWIKRVITLRGRRPKVGESQVIIPTDQDYGFLFMIYDMERKGSFIFPFALMLRAVVFAALTMFLPYNPVAQAAIMLSISCLFLIYTLLIRPFKRTFHLIFQVLNELAVICYLAVLVHLANNMDNEDSASIIGDICIALSLFIPFIGIVFACADILLQIFRRNPIKNDQKYFEKNPVKVGTPAQNSVASLQKVDVFIKTPDSVTPTRLRLSDIIHKVVREEEPIKEVAIEFKDLSNSVEIESLDKAESPVHQDHSGEEDQETKVFSAATQTEDLIPLPKQIKLNSPFLERIEPIYEEELEKEQASAELQGNQRRKVGFSIATQVGSSPSQSSEEKSKLEKMKEMDSQRESKTVIFAHPIEDQINLYPARNSNSGNSSFREGEAHRTQDKVKNQPFSLDVPAKSLKKEDLFESIRSRRSFGISPFRENENPRQSFSGGGEDERERNRLPQLRSLEGFSDDNFSRGSFRQSQTFSEPRIKKKIFDRY